MKKRLYVPACERSYEEVSEPTEGGCHALVKELSLSRSIRLLFNAMGDASREILGSTLDVTIN
jgi:hypothetical protein